MSLEADRQELKPIFGFAKGHEQGSQRTRSRWEIPVPILARSCRPRDLGDSRTTRVPYHYYENEPTSREQLSYLVIVIVARIGGYTSCLLLLLLRVIRVVGVGEASPTRA